MKNLLVLAAIFLLISCIGEKETTSTKSSSPADLYGSWKNTTLKVIMKSEGMDSILVAKDGEWESVLGIKPIVTTFNTDSTFTSDYYTLDDQLFHTTVGVWWIRNDSLVMLTEDELTAYNFSKEENKIHFTSNLDWNVDGTLDSYEGTQIRVE